MIELRPSEKSRYTESHDKPRRGPARLLSVLVAFAAPTSANPPPANASVANAATESAWTMGLIAPVAVGAASHEQAIRSLKESTGLTWQQIADAFGVSRRAVHFWLNGGALSNRHLIRFHEIQNAVAAVDAQDPASARAALMTPAASGVSPLDQLIAAARPARTTPKQNVRDALGIEAASLRRLPYRVMRRRRCDAWRGPARSGSPTLT